MVGKYRQERKIDTCELRCLSRAANKTRRDKIREVIRSESVQHHKGKQRILNESGK